MANNKEFSFKIGNINEIIEEKNNQFIALREIYWGAKVEPKLDIRKYYVDTEGQEKMGKGVSLTKEGSDILAETMLKIGCGDPNEIVSIIKEHRNDIIDALNNETSENEEGFFDPRRLLD